MAQVKNQGAVHQFTAEEFEIIDVAMSEVEAVIDALRFLDQPEGVLKGNTPGALLDMAAKRIDEAREIFNK